MADPKYAIVTGGERGIGRAIVDTLLAKGYQVSVLGRDGESAKSLPDSVAFCDCDMASYEEIANAVQTICASTGQLHALVCNAGIASPKRLPRFSMWRCAES